MTVKRTFNCALVATMIAICVIIVLAGRTCINMIVPGTGLGEVANVESARYSPDLYIKCLDSFFKIYPEYRKPENINGSINANTYNFLDLTSFYFKSRPQEIYYVQWNGTGFITVRFAYNLDKGVEVYENHRNKAHVANNEKQRIGNRFRNEILSRLDSIIARSQHTGL